jgi:hypothetical protein
MHLCWHTVEQQFSPALAIASVADTSYIKRKKMSYNIEELRMRKDTNDEQIRTRKIFLDLKAKTIKGENRTNFDK